MGDDAEPLELLEVAVNGRDVDVGRLRLDLGGEIFGGPVARRRQRLPVATPTALARSP
jgi:hypothetical protein